MDLSAIIGPVVESLLIPVKKHLGYMFSFTKHVSNMSTRMKQLDGASDDVKRHMETNNRNNLEIPTSVPNWLEEVKQIKEDAERISSNVNGCFNLKTRYRSGRKAFKTTEKIEALIKENNETNWRDAQKPLQKVSSKLASTSDGDAHIYFKSREKIFKEALGLLQQDQKAHVIALCGMGSVGKTTMMEQLIKAVEDKKMFDWVVKVVIGQNINILSIQQTVAEYIKLQLTEKDKTARADRLCVTFGKMSQESKKVLVVLDDVWEMVELKDIGLSPLPNGFKLLLTSRDENVCTQIAVEANSDLRVVKVEVMEESEANNFFCQISEVSNPDLKGIGAEIVRRCGFLPLAIKLIATNLKFQEKPVWRDTLRRLKKNDLDENVKRIIEMSYDFIAEEDAKAVFLLCGLFPDDFNIPMEDLTRYAWGLKLLREVTTPGEARDRTKTCVRILKDASLLIDSDYSECVKMHDLVLAFVVAKVSKGDHPWIINHGDLSNWSTTEMNESCRRISLTCMGMSEFPRDFNYPNISLLRLMNGNESLKFPDDFYEKMENLQVIAFEKLHYPLLPGSLQCSTTLRTLCLHQCSLMFDCSAIGHHLLNLEVLSFSYSGIRYLPSAIGNLVKLKLLDLTGCIGLRIDEGVLKNLVKLEELYMRVANEKGIKFTDINYKELGERSKNLSALEVEFIENNPHSKNMSYNKLERFSISMGRFLEYVGGVRGSHNRLMLEVANKDELLESGLNVLFLKTEVLYLEAGSGMNNLEEVLPKSVPRHSLFYNLRVLRVYRCVDLRYLFTVPVARGLVKLERLTIDECPVMEALVYSEENGEEEEGVDDIRFQVLKHLWLEDLPKLVGLSNTNNIVIHLPQLVELYLQGLPNVSTKGVNFTDTNYKELAERSKNLSAFDFEFFKNNPHSKNMLYNKLERFKISIGRFLEANSGKDIHSSKNMLMLVASKDDLLESGIHELFSKTEVLHLAACCGMKNLEEVLRESVPQYSFCNLRVLDVSRCTDLRYLFTVPVASGLMKLERLTIQNCPVMEALVYSENGEEGVIMFQELKHLVLDNLPMLVCLYNVNDVIDLPQLVELVLRGLPNFTCIYPECKSAPTSVMSSSSSATYVKSCSSSAINPFFNKKVMIPRLQRLEIYCLEALKNIWPCGSSEKVDAYLLREIRVGLCENLMNMFPSNPMPLLHHLETVDVDSCGSIEVLAYSENGERGVIRFPELKHLSLRNLPKLVGLSNTNDVIDLTQLMKLVLTGLPNFTSIYPEYKSVATSHMSSSSSHIKPFFNKEVLTPRLERLGIYHMEALKNIWPCGNSEEIDACLLREISVGLCDNLVNMFPMPLLHRLETISIDSCRSIEVLVYGENGEEGVIRFQELKHLALGNLPIFVGFCNTNNVIDLPQLVKLVLTRLPNFTSIYPDYKSASAATSEMCSSSSAIKPFFNKEVMIPHGLERMEIYHMEALKNIWPCGSSEEIEVDACLLREIKVENCNNLVNMFPINPMRLLYHLERITVTCCDSIEVLFDIDVACLGEMKESDSKLRFIRVLSSGKLREVWRLKGVINSDVIYGFQDVECILIIGCKSFRNIFTPPTARFDLGADIITAGSNYNGSEEVNENGTERNQEEVPALNIKKSASEGNLK